MSLTETDENEESGLGPVLLDEGWVGAAEHSWL